MTAERTTEREVAAGTGDTRAPQQLELFPRLAPPPVPRKGGLVDLTKQNKRRALQMLGAPPASKRRPR